MQSRTSEKTKKSWVAAVLNAVRKVFKFIRQALQVIGEIIQEIIHTSVFLFSIILKFISSPSTPCLLAIVVFGFAIIIAEIQWYGVGMWIAGIVGFESYAGYSLGVLGVLFGFAINMFQLSAEMWKISRQFADYYAAKNVDPNMETSADVGVKERISNWLSFDHKNLKVMRRISYVLETGLMLAYSFSQFNFLALLMGAIALTAPEQALKFVSSTISLLGKISEFNSDKDAAEDVNI
jgi:hypothetical protein